MQHAHRKQWVFLAEDGCTERVPVEFPQAVHQDGLEAEARTEAVLLALAWCRGADHPDTDIAVRAEFPQGRPEDVVVGDFGDTRTGCSDPVRRDIRAAVH